jgi:hypothetical protein
VILPVLQAPHWHVDDCLAALLTEEPTTSTISGVSAPAADTTIAGGDHPPDCGSSGGSDPITNKQHGVSDRGRFRPAVGPQAVMALAQHLLGQREEVLHLNSSGSGSGGAEGGVYVEGLCYGNMDAQSARRVGDLVVGCVSGIGMAEALRAQMGCDVVRLQSCESLLPAGDLQPAPTGG